MDINNLIIQIDERQGELFDLLSQLIRINSENYESHGNEKNLSTYIERRCETWGLKCDIYSPMDLADFDKHPDYLPGRGLDDRYNVTVRFPGEEDKDHLMLMAHSDTVVIGDPAMWTVDPLGGEIREGKIWGRGACDDKYAIAAALFLMHLLKENGVKLKENLLFTAYCDEERGGSHGALAAVIRYPCKKIVNMDSMNFELSHCAAGGGEYKYMYHTAKVTDTARQAADAIPVILRVIDTFGQRRRDELKKNKYYKDSVLPETALRYMGVHAGNHGADLGVGEIEFIYYTDKNKEEIQKELSDMETVLQDLLKPLGIIGDGFFPTTRFFHYAVTDPNCEAIHLLQEAAAETSGREIFPSGSCLSDLSVCIKYSEAEAFEFGIDREFNETGGCHQPDEFIECAKLVEFTKIMAAYILKVLKK